MMENVTAVVAMPANYEINLETDSDYLALLTRKLFHSGFNKQIVDAKWAAFENAFHGFDPARVASFDEADLERLAANSALVRHRRKLAATLANARHFCEVAKQHGSWMTWLHGQRHLPYEERAVTLQGCLTHCGPNTVFYFLFEAGEATLDDRPDGVR
jgi:3-methyladenine DNA glycosylase Tag